jgi:hypothetical protein
LIAVFVAVLSIAVVLLLVFQGDMFDPARRLYSSWRVAVIWAVELALCGTWTVAIVILGQAMIDRTCGEDVDCDQIELNLKILYSIGLVLTIVVVAFVIVGAMRASSAPRRVLVGLLEWALIPFGIIAVAIGVVTFFADLTG